MQFFTHVQAHTLPALHYSDKLICLGSCFADRIGQQFLTARFQTLVNPYGVLFNPLTIGEALRGAMIPEIPVTLHRQDGLWISFDYHSKLAASTEQEALKNIEQAHKQLRKALVTSDWLIVTFGTAWAYRQRLTGKVVANCHHFPASDFVRELLSVDAIVEMWVSLFSELRNFNPDLRVLFTVSPVRHLREGMMDNSVSKATLLLAVNLLMKVVKDVYYFPSYEIMMDELRDYRFYEADMTQPNDIARQYIWSRLAEAWFAPDTALLLSSIEKYRKMEAHIPMNPHSENYETFLRKREALRKAIESEIEQKQNRK